MRALFRGFSRRTHRLLRRRDSGHFRRLGADAVQGDAAPGSLGAVASLGLQGAGQADQPRGVGRGRIDPDGVVAVLLVEGREGPGQKRGMMRVVGIVGEPDQDPGPIARAAPGRRGRELGMVAQDRVASLDRRGQFGLGAADFGGAQRVDVEIEPAQTEDVGIAGRVPRSSQPVVRPGQQVGPHGVEGNVARDAAQPVGLFDQPLVVVEPAGERAAPEAAA